MQMCMWLYSQWHLHVYSLARVLPRCVCTVWYLLRANKQVLCFRQYSLLLSASLVLSVELCKGLSPTCLQCKWNNLWMLACFLAALAALYLTLVTDWVGDCNFRIFTQRVTFETSDPSDIWSAWCLDENTKRQKDKKGKKTKRQKDRKTTRQQDKNTKRLKD